MEKVFKVADIRDLEQKVALGEMSYSRMVEVLNEKAEEHYSKVKKLNEPVVSNNEVSVETEKHKCINCGKEYEDIDDAIMCCYVSETDC